MELFPLVLLATFAVVLFVLPARQRKRMQAQAQALQESLRIGTPVTTTSGIHGTVAALAEKTVDLELAPGVVVTFARPAIMEIRRPAGSHAGSTGTGGTGTGGTGTGGTGFGGTGTEGTGTEGPGNGAAGGRPADGTV